MKTIAVIGLLLALAGESRAQFDFRETLVTRSASGQFQIYARRSDVPSRFAIANTNAISLEPALLAVSCERIKQALLGRLGSAGPWQGRISLHLRPARNSHAQVTIVADRMPNGWNYRMDLPDSLEQTGFLQSIVQVLLMEIANRNAESRLAEIPLWLTQGFSQELLASEETELLLLPPRAIENGLNISRLIVDRRKRNPIEHAQRTLRTHPPLTFEQLSWPVTEQLSGQASDVFRSSAQLFVNQLLQMKDGPACLRATLNDLPRRLNWQFAFLNGFQPHFHSLLDVEKWWALQIVQFTGRDLMRTWTVEESCRKLQAVILSPLNVREKAGDLPLRTEVSLQTIIRDGNFLLQTQTLQRKLMELESVRLHVSQETISLVDDYRRVLDTYLKALPLSGSFLPVRNQDVNVTNASAQETIRQLDALDEQRQALLAAALKSIAGTPVTAP